MGSLAQRATLTVATERLSRILALLAVESTAGETSRLCAVAAEVTAVSGAGIMLLSGEAPQGSLCSTDAVSKLIEDLQYTVGEGPCVDAHRDGTITSEPDLADPVVARWPGFTPSALHAGARAVFGFPVRVGAVRLGALNLYRARPGPLGDDHHAAALVIAGVAARAILALQADADPGVVAAELDDSADFHLAVHQAAGMVSVQLDVPVVEALVRLRAHACRSWLPPATPCAPWSCSSCNPTRARASTATGPAALSSTSTWPG